MKHPHRALEAIERLVGSDFGLEMEWHLHDKAVKDRRWLEDNLKQAARVITDVYLIAHAEGHCTGHPSWEDKKEEILATPSL